MAGLEPADNTSSPSEAELQDEFLQEKLLGEQGVPGRALTPADRGEFHSIHDLRHPQSLLAYEMNGERLPILHGRPLRLRVENQLGFKHVKWISEIEFVHHFRERYAGQGGYQEDHEFFGYRDEI